MSTQSLPYIYGVIKDWSGYTDYYQRMAEHKASGDTTQYENVKSMFANEICYAYANDGDDTTNIDFEQALKMAEMTASMYKYTPAVNSNVVSGTTGTTGATGTPGTTGTPSVSTPMGMTAGVVDWSVYDTQIQVMHSRLSGNDEEAALDMRQQMAQSVMTAYENAGQPITKEEALSYVDSRYQQVTGKSLVATIEETTKSSFWNYVPLVNLFVEEPSAEDLYKVMEGKKLEDVEHKEAEKNGWGVAGTVTTYTAIGAGIGTAICPGLGSAIGAGAGLIVGGVCELIDWLC